LDRSEPAKASFLFLFCALTAVGLFLKEKGASLPRKHPLWRATSVLGIFWVLDLLMVPSRVLRTVPDPYRLAPVVEAAQEARLWAGEGRMVSLRATDRYYPSGVKGPADSMRATAQALLPNAQMVLGLKSAAGHLSIRSDGHQNLVRYLQRGHPYEGRVLDAAGVKLLVLPGALSPFKYSVHEPRHGSVFTRNAGAMGSAWEAGRVREFPDRKAVFEALLDAKAFLEDEVYLERGGPEGPVRLAPSDRKLRVKGPSFLGRLEGWADRLYQGPTQIGRNRTVPCEAFFEVIPPGGGSLIGIPSKEGRRPKLGGAYVPSATDAGRWLVFSESFAPGWKVWVNGTPKPIFRANGLFMAVPVPGKDGGKVVFRYGPAPFRLGAFLGLLAWTAWIILLATRIIRRARGWGGLLPLR
jgi:hypothetical protein